jgi:hypothetical protein
MNEYEVRFVFELVNITTIAICRNKEQAKGFAEMNLANAGIILDEDPKEIVITKTGEYK